MEGKCKVEPVAPPTPVRKISSVAPPPPPPPATKSKADFPPTQPKPPPVAAPPVAKAVPPQPHQLERPPPVFQGTAPVMEPPTTPRPEVPPQVVPITLQIVPQVVPTPAAVEAARLRREAQTARMRHSIEQRVAAGNARITAECMEQVAQMFEEQDEWNEDTTGI